jgi:SOS response associated peptidase (SRAP)
MTATPFRSAIISPCGYRLSRRKQLIEEYFASVSRGEEDWSPRYNVAPTQPVPVIRQNPKELFNAEDVTFTLVGAAACREHEARVLGCIEISQVPNSSRCFYEWMRTGKTKQPYCFEVNDGQLFALVGIRNRWKDASVNRVKTCSILTTPNAVTSAIHLDDDEKQNSGYSRDCVSWCCPCGHISNGHPASEELRAFFERGRHRRNWQDKLRRLASPNGADSNSTPHYQLQSTNMRHRLARRK